MFHIESVDIEGFWGGYRLHTNLHKDVNIIIGKNGTGKTHFMNFLFAVLMVDLRILRELEFERMTVQLADKSFHRQIVVTKRVSEDSIPMAEFKIASEVFRLPLFAREEDFVRYFTRRTLHYDAYRSARLKMKEIVNVTSLSVHRVANEFYAASEDEVVARRREAKPPIDHRLGDLLQKLTSYQLSLAEQSGKISADFQQGVLNSILYDEQFDKFNMGEKYNVELDKQREAISKAYKQLIPDDPNQADRINSHIEAISRSLNALSKLPRQTELNVDDILPLPLLRRTQRIIDLSLQAEMSKQVLFEPMLQFEKILKGFLSDKEITVNSGGEMIVQKDKKEIPIDQLSSGEKQILILLTEAVLEKRQFYIFLADEPEISLHIEWQEKVISSLQELNPRTQIIVATHSPEIAAGRKNNIINMADIINA